MTGTTDLMTNLLRCTLDPAFDDIVTNILLQLDGFSISSFFSVNKEWNAFLVEKLKYSNLLERFDCKLAAQWIDGEPSKADVTVSMGVKHLACDDKVIVTADDDTVEVRHVKTGELLKELAVNNVGTNRICFQNKNKSDVVKEIFTSSSIFGAVCYPKRSHSNSIKIFGAKNFGFVYIWSKEDFKLVTKLKFELLGDDQSGEKETETKHKMKVTMDKLVMVQQEEENRGSIYWHPMGKKLFFHSWDVKNSSKFLKDTNLNVEHVSELFTPARDIQIDHDGKLLAFSTCLETNVFDMKSGSMLYNINMLDPKVNLRNSDDVLLNMQVRRTTMRYPMVIIDCEHKYTGMGRIFVYNLEEAKTISHHAWDEQDYAITEDFTIRADSGSKYDLNVYAVDACTELEKVKFVIEENKTALYGVKSRQRELMVDVGSEVTFCANKTSIVTLSHTVERNALTILNFWLNKR